MSKHMKFKWLTKVTVYKFEENAHKIQKKGYSGIIPFVYVGKEEILKFYVI